MSLTMFIVGFIIFGAYVYLMCWSIFYNSRKQQEENYPNLNGMGQSIDYDGKYYERYHTRYKKRPKTKQGSQSRKKNYKIEKTIKG